MHFRHSFTSATKFHSSTLCDYRLNQSVAPIANHDLSRYPTEVLFWWCSFERSNTLQVENILNHLPFGVFTVEHVISSKKFHWENGEWRWRQKDIESLTRTDSKSHSTCPYCVCSVSWHNEQVQIKHPGSVLNCPLI